MTKVLQTALNTEQNLLCELRIRILEIFDRQSSEKLLSNEKPGGTYVRLLGAHHILAFYCQCIVLFVILQETMEEKLMIIDTDCGIDDAQAIMMALAAPNIHILGITCVFGNTTVDNVCQNVLRVLSVCERNGVRLLKLSEQPQSEKMQICVF